ncbi:hypothetical protein H6503_00050 [Candidatus Woesearchaeota archaeon]|nr:hypothetical protein [Candidatus Woesearchaeota archaeon]
MAHIDTIFNIKRLYANLFLAKPFLTAKGIYEPDLLLGMIKDNGSVPFRSEHTEDNLGLIDILENAFMDAKEQDERDENEDIGRSKVMRMRKYKMQNEFLMQELSKTGEENPMHGKIPVFVSGLCITDEMLMQKEGIDPYSNKHLFSNLLLDFLPSLFPQKFLEIFRFIYIQPTPYVQVPILDQVNGFGIEEMLRSRIEREINPLMNIGFGDLVKFDYISPKKGNSYFRASMFENKGMEIEIAKNHDNYAPEATRDGRLDWTWFLDRHKLNVYLNKQIMAIKFAGIRDMMFPHIIDKLLDYEIDAIPIYMENTSASADIMLESQKYVDIPFDLQFIGGKHGILANAPDRLPREGICHPTAFGRLLGFMEDIYKKWSGGSSINAERKSPVQKPSAITYDSSGKYPWLLLERGTEHSTPNLHDIAAEYLDQEQITLVENLARIHRVGFTRVEPRIVTLHNVNFDVYKGFRRDDKDNYSWFNESRDKRWITPDKIPGFKEMVSRCADRRKKGDFRGSELALPVGPQYSPEFAEDLNVGEANLGCIIANAVGAIRKKEAFRIIKEQLGHESEEVVQEFFRTHNANTLESIYSKRGIAVHDLFSRPMEGLVHYDTLELAGIEPVSSDNYCETPFRNQMSIITRDGKIDFIASIHPDAYLFMERGENEYDLILIDRKVNRVTPYPEHKYQLQTLFYGWSIADIVERELGAEVVNIYTVLDKNAFYRGFGDQEVVSYPHTTYRKPKYSPITLWTPDDPMRDAIPNVAASIQQRKQDIISDPGVIPEMKAMNEECGLCSKCFDEAKILCNYMKRKVEEKEEVRQHWSQLSSVSTTMQ